jgi:protein-S-isoprenylcysteine O-methyltransferase Ste14
VEKFRILAGLISILITAFSILISLYIRSEYNQNQLWFSVDFIAFNWFFALSFFSVIHLSMGGIIFCLSFYQCILIVKVNNQAHISKNQPQTLLENGYYSKVRHPMTERFLLIIISFFFMINSIISLPLIALFASIFILITFYEERKILLPIFGEKYIRYMTQVKNRFFTLKMKILVTFLLLFMIFGVLFI